MYLILKRFFDLLLALTGLLFTGWFLVPCMLILWCTGEHYIWYLQKRIGYKNKYFNIIKFATMPLASPSMGTGSLTTRDDPRVLPFGKFLRKTKINELPQIFNVFNGTMSIVGPRPERVEHVEKYSKDVPEFEYRLKVKGGLTGYAQIYGKYNTSAYDKLRLDLMYIEKYSLKTD